MPQFLESAMGQEKEKNQTSKQKPKPWEATTSNSNDNQEMESGKFQKFFFLLTIDQFYKNYRI